MTTTDGLLLYSFVASTLALVLTIVSVLLTRRHRS